MHCHFRLIIDGFLKWSTFIIAMILNKLFSKAFVIPTNQDFKDQHPSWGLFYHTVCGTCVSFSLLYRNLIQAICEGDMFIWVHSFAGLQSKIGKSLLVQSLVVMLLAKGIPWREGACVSVSPLRKPWECDHRGTPWQPRPIWAPSKGLFSRQHNWMKFPPRSTINIGLWGPNLYYLILWRILRIQTTWTIIAYGHRKSGW